MVAKQYTGNRREVKYLCLTRALNPNIVTDRPTIKTFNVALRPNQIFHIILWQPHTKENFEWNDQSIDQNLLSFRKCHNLYLSIYLSDSLSVFSIEWDIIYVHIWELWLVPFCLMSSAYKPWNIKCRRKSGYVCKYLEYCIE